MTAKPGRVAVLTSHHILHDWLIQRLAGQFEICLVLYERYGRDRALRLAARRAKRLGWGPVSGQLVYMVWDRLYVQPASRAAIKRMLGQAQGNLPDPLRPEWREVEVESINGAEVALALAAFRPDVCVVAGTSIIKPHILEKAPLFLNIHAGITPRYRGAHGAFWAVCEGRPDLAGVTVHKVDPGIDTGEIVGQATIQLARDDTPRTLVAKQYLAGWPLMDHGVQRALSGTLQTYRRTDLESRLWYSASPADYFRFRRQLAKLTT